MDLRGVPRTQKLRRRGGLDVALSARRLLRRAPRPGRRRFAGTPVALLADEGCTAAAGLAVTNGAKRCGTCTKSRIVVSQRKHTHTTTASLLARMSACYAAAPTA